MAGIRRFEEIASWQKARELVRAAYGACSAGPLAKDFGLKDQICRASVSVMSNIAEGFARKGDKDFAHFLDMARGSAAEVQSLVYVAKDLGYIDENVFSRLYGLSDEAQALIAGLTSYLRNHRK
ncbi:MAG: four helix bundle protein [Deltaproteobacteria bacterium]|nr:four helix bundle protein [Deltaproteobacteria bacterium]